MKPKTNNQLYLFLLLAILSIGIVNCERFEKTSPKPYGYARIELPTHRYFKFDSLGFPYAFQVSEHSLVLPSGNHNEPYWINITYPKLNAMIYISYKPLSNNLLQLSEESRQMVYKHSIRADAIYEKTYENKDKNVYGLFYELTGNTASTLQFILTDSTRHFIRAALYFEQSPNADSIAPVAQYIQEDMIHLINSFEWKK